MVRQKKTTGRPSNSHKKKGGGGLILVVAVLVLVMFMGFLFASYKTPNTEHRSFSDIVSEIIPKGMNSDKSLQADVKSEEKAPSSKDNVNESLEKKQQKAQTAKDKATDKNTVIPSSHSGLSGRIAVVVDDCGYDLGPVETLTSLPIDMAFSIIPFKANSSAALKLIIKNGQLPMLHLPMEPMDASEASENRMVTVAMTKEEAQKFTEEAIDSLPGIKGVNNHQGSKATSNTATMEAVLEVLRSRGLFFVDSRTIASSVAYKVARQLDISTGRNSLFLDNSSNVASIKKQIWAAANIANKYGSVIVICHARPATAQAWVEIYKEVQKAGITFVPVTDLLT
ncbi:MAG: divergent polysaccharide deacetylase family protein [Acidaminococcaceae bacterium]|nr:divergent polysaccharide deacetylase family protein [Acidaminococcaceae bacterium]